MPRLHADVSGSDGQTHYEAGEKPEVSTEHAKRVVLRGLGRLIDDKGRAVPRAQALKQLRASADEIARHAAPARKRKG